MKTYIIKSKAVIELGMKKIKAENRNSAIYRYKKLYPDYYKFIEFEVGEDSVV